MNQNCCLMYFRDAECQVVCKMGGKLIVILMKASVV